ncbi:MAG: hypothetical protein AB9873_06515 [Syntrophobacteraceae bacterium]
MGRKLVGIVGLLSTVLFASVALAGDYVAPDNASKGEPMWRFKPSFSMGYAFGGDMDLTVTLTDRLSLLGETAAKLEVPSFSGVYIAGEFPFAITDRLLITLAGRWAFSAADDSSLELYNERNDMGRLWDSDGRDWVTADLLVSYAVVKDLGFLKELSGAMGFRFDHHAMSFENAHRARGVVSIPSNTVEFEMNTYSPVFGVTSTLMGPKSGIFGGDIKLSFFGSPVGFGDMNFEETFGPVLRIEHDGDLDDVAFYSFYGEVTALSGKVSPGMTASLSLFGQYTEFFIEGETTSVSTPFVGERSFDFGCNPSLAVVGLKASLAF